MSLYKEAFLQRMKCLVLKLFVQFVSESGNCRLAELLPGQPGDDLLHPTGVPCVLSSTYIQN